MQTMKTAMDKLTRAITAMDSYEALKASCRAGYVPTLLKGTRQDALAAALRSEGLRVWRGSNEEERAYDILRSNML